VGNLISNEVKQQLIRIVGAENYDDSKAGRLVYSYDATPQFQSLPDAVVAPRNTEEVSRIVKICNEHRIPIVPRGSAGIYNIVEPEMSMQILDYKMEMAKQTKATTIVTANPGCLLQMQLGIERTGLADRVRAVHIVDFLLEAAKGIQTSEQEGPIRKTS
jgi:FAD binding domain/Cysteine-rich domain